MSCIEGVAVNVVKREQIKSNSSVGYVKETRVKCTDSDIHVVLSLDFNNERSDFRSFLVSSSIFAFPTFIPSARHCNKESSEPISGSISVAESPLLKKEGLVVRSLIIMITDVQLAAVSNWLGSFGMVLIVIYHVRGISA